MHGNHTHLVPPTEFPAVTGGAGALLSAAGQPNPIPPPGQQGALSPPASQAQLRPIDNRGVSSSASVGCEPPECPLDRKKHTGRNMFLILFSLHDLSSFYFLFLCTAKHLQPAQAPALLSL